MLTLEIDRIYNEDCMKGMERLPAQSVDMVLCDLPYGTTQCAWDTHLPLSLLWKHYDRILKHNGWVCLFAAQPYSSELVQSNKAWFSHNLVWHKEGSGNHLLANKQPLRVHEDILLFRRPNLHGMEFNTEAREYFKALFAQIGLTKAEIKRRVGGRADHCFRFDSAQWELCSEETYQDIIKCFGLIDVLPYSELVEMRGGDYVYNPQFTKGKPYVSRAGGKSGAVTGEVEKRVDTVNTGWRYPTSILRFARDERGLHPTQKPVRLCEYLLRTYTKKNAVVLDNCIGCGTTAIAALNTGRHFIGFELNGEYFQVAEKRIGEHKIYEQVKLYDD